MFIQLFLQQEELLTADKIDAKVGNQVEYENRIYDLQDEVCDLLDDPTTPACSTTTSLEAS